MKALKVIGWLLLATLLLVVVLYLTLVAINWKDRPPSAAARQFEQLIAARPDVSVDDNAVAYLMGFGAPTEGDPVEAGAKRMAWLKDFGPNTRPDTDPLRDGLNFQGEGSPLVSHLVNACGQDADRLQCASVFDSVARAWQPSDLDALALRRYEALLTRRAWRDVVPLDLSAPLPGYASVMHAQRLYLLRLAQWAVQGRVDEVRLGLEADFAFWRTAVPSADSLIGQMIAVAALRQHFSYANLILQGLSPQQVTRGLPADWTHEFSATERSMRRVMAAEVAFFKTLLADEGRKNLALDIAADWVSRLSNPMFKLQDTVNSRADLFLRLCETFEVPMNRYLEAQQSWKKTIPESGTPLYNPVGSIILSAEDGSSYEQYVLRVASLEGMRRAALLAFQLHANGVAAEAVNGLVMQSSLRDPYTEHPFAWDAERRSVTFTAPENHRWRRSEFFY